MTIVKSYTRPTNMGLAFLDAAVKSKTHTGEVVVRLITKDDARYTRRECDQLRVTDDTLYFLNKRMA